VRGIRADEVLDGQLLEWPLGSEELSPPNGPDDVTVFPGRTRTSMQANSLQEISGRMQNTPEMPSV
jgi:hypothetical protein